jgi:hypothetical protein
MHAVTVTTWILASCKFSESNQGICTDESSLQSCCPISDEVAGPAIHVRQGDTMKFTLTKWVE